MNYDQLLSKRVSRMDVNILREILKSASRPGIISLAGGIPAPESFPTDIIAALTTTVLKTYGASALQYGPTEGFYPLREAVSHFIRKKGIMARPDDVQITSGSQGALDAIGKILISKGDKVAIESPTYLGALHAFNPYEPEYVRIEADEDGPIPEKLERLLESHKIKFIYLVPTFQNPTGNTISLKRRKEIADVICRQNALLVEDDPYSDLRYQGEDIIPIQTLATDHVIYLGTFSKILAPGLRVGYCLAPKAIKKWMIIAKQGIDLHTGSLSQAIASFYLTEGYIDDHLPLILNFYKPRLAAMLEGLEAYFPSGFSWSRPEGGMFVWVKGPEGLDMGRIHDEAFKENIAFVPGRYFHIGHREGLETMRLNFTMHDEKTIRNALHLLADILERNVSAGFHDQRVTSFSYA
ncbi:MAG: PLP-dependent aminotransferase family protein [Proteobacteria bacterium]|nr:PLP-dependent aminotransferase family protein [Pseudomonadota bacterium]